MPLLWTSLRDYLVRKYFAEYFMRTYFVCVHTLCVYNVHCTRACMHAWASVKSVHERERARVHRASKNASKRICSQRVVTCEGSQGRNTQEQTC